MLRVVVDTNIVVSAYLSRNGVPAQVLKAWPELVFSVALPQKNALLSALCGFASAHHTCHFERDKLY